MDVVFAADRAKFALSEEASDRDTTEYSLNCASVVMRSFEQARPASVATE